MGTQSRTRSSGPARPAEPVASGVISFSGAQCTATCRVSSVSGIGCWLSFDPDDWLNPVASAPDLPNAFRLTVPDLGIEADCLVATRSKLQIAVRFVGRVRSLPPEFRRKRKFKGA